jgi:hypothetical protein
MGLMLLTIPAPHNQVIAKPMPRQQWAGPQLASQPVEATIEANAPSSPSGVSPSGSEGPAQAQTTIRQPADPPQPMAAPVPAALSGPPRQPITPPSSNSQLPQSPQRPPIVIPQAHNLLKNPDYSIPGIDSHTEIVGVRGGNTAAADWSANNNTPGKTTTELLDSTRTPGKKMLKVCTTAYNSGVFQDRIAGAPGRAVASVWVYLFSGDVVAMGIGNGGATGVTRPYDTTIGKWIELTVSNDGPATEMIVNAYSTQHNPTCFALDSASLTAIA